MRTEDQTFAPERADITKLAVTPEQARTFSRLTAPLLIIVGAVLRILSYAYSDNSGGDAWARVSLTAEWLAHPTFKVVFDAYPPGQFWLIALVHLLVPNLTVAGRGLSLLLGILSLPVLWRLTRTLYGNTAATLSLAVFTFYSLHIGYSSTSSGEVCYVFFLLLALQLFFEGIVTGSVWRFAVSGVALTVSDLVRLEAWAIFFALTVAWVTYCWRDLRDRVNFRPAFAKLVAFGLCGGIGPLFLMVYCWAAFRDPLRILTLHNVLVTESMRDYPVPLEHQLLVIPATLLITLSPVALCAALYGFFKSFSVRPALQFAAVTLFFALLQNYEIVRGKLLSMPRYSLTLGAMMAVTSGYGFCCLGRKLRPRYFQAAVVTLLVVNLLAILFVSEWPSSFSEKFATISPRVRYTKHVSAVSRFLHDHLGPEDAALIDDYNSESNIIAAAAGLPLVPGRRAYVLNTKYEFSPVQYLIAEHPRFVVYSDQGELQRWLPLPSTCAGTQVSGVIFRCVMQDEVYRIYELQYP